MSKLEELIQQYCPDGVEYVKLGDFATQWYRGAGIKKDEISQEGIPCIRYGEIHTIYKIWFDKCISHTDEAKQPSKKYADYGDILFAITSEDIPFIGNSVAYMGQERIMVGGDIVVMKHTQNPKYISYALSTIDAVSQKGKGKVKSKVVHTNVPSLKEIVIPVPPLPVQEEIVRILDDFTELQAELQAELQKRKLQYNYYLDNLQSFNRGQTEVRWMKLKDVATQWYRGAGIKREEVSEDGMPCIRYGEIHTTYNIWFDDCISHADESKQVSRKYAEKGDILFAITSEDVPFVGNSVAYLGNERILVGGDIVVMKHNQDPKYMAYALSTSDAIKQKGKGKVKSKVVHTNVPSLQEIVIPIPSMTEQERIASILDRFNTLTTDLTQGLPAEIEKRRQQYEYYRDKLLTFKRKEA